MHGAVEPYNVSIVPQVRRNVKVNPRSRVGSERFFVCREGERQQKGVKRLSEGWGCKPR